MNIIRVSYEHYHGQTMRKKCEKCDVGRGQGFIYEFLYSYIKKEFT